MKHLLAKSFLALALLGGMSSVAFGSEVLGTLSSEGGNANQTGQQNTGVPSTNPQSDNSTAPDNGSLAGNVSESQGSSNRGGNGGGGSSGGEVLGEKTMAATSSPAPTSPATSTANRFTTKEATAPISSDGSNSPTAEDSLFSANQQNSTASGSVIQPQTASVLEAFSQISRASWFWIIALTLLLIAVIGYIYNHERHLARSRQLHF